MNNARQEQLLASQSAIARKIFGAVPIREPWDSNAVPNRTSKALVRTLMRDAT